MRSWTGERGRGEGDNMHGWASVGHGVDICLNYNTAHSKKDKKKKRRKKNRQTKYRKAKRESRVTEDHSTKYVVSLY